MICTCSQVREMPMCSVQRIDLADGSHPPVIQARKPKESEIWLVAVEAEGHWLLREPPRKDLWRGF